MLELANRLNTPAPCRRAFFHCYHLSAAHRARYQGRCEAAYLSLSGRLENRLWHATKPYGLLSANAKPPRDLLLLLARATGLLKTVTAQHQLASAMQLLFLTARAVRDG